MLIVTKIYDFGKIKIIIIMTCDNVLGERADKTLEAKDDKAEDCIALLCDGL